MQAVGRIAAYQIVTSSVWLLCLPLTWLAFRGGLPPYSVYGVMIAINAALLGVRLWYLRRYCRIPIGVYMRDVAGRMAVVPVAGAAAATGVAALTPAGLPTLLASTAAQTVAIAATSYAMGIIPRRRHH